MGVSIFVGTKPLGLALAPGGRYAILSNDSDRDGALAAASAQPGLFAGSSLAVVDTQTMKVVSVYHDPSMSFYMGVAATRDPGDASRTIVLASDSGAGAVRIFDLDAAGQLSPEQSSLVLPPNGKRPAVPAGIALAPGGRTAYVADNSGDSVAVLDLSSRTVSRTIPVGDFPLYVTATGASVLAPASGLSAYAAADVPVAHPQFALPAFDPDKSSSLSVLDLAESGDAAGDPMTVHMDQAPDGSQSVGGASPGATVVTPDGQFAYVALANVDRVAVVALEGQPHVVRGLDLRLYPGAPYGAQPSAEALSPDGKRLYVALAGLNAVAVLDAQRPTRYRYGLVPTGWYPTAVAVSPNGRYLYVAAGKGVDGWGMLQRIDLKHTSLVKATLAALRYNRTPAVAKFSAVIPPLRSNRRSDAIDHVVYVAIGTQSFDGTLGDLTDPAGNARGRGDASFVVYPKDVTPNLHALAQTYALADNFYAPDPDLDIAQQFAVAGDATLYSQLEASLSEPSGDRGDDPEDYERAGYLFNSLARAGLSFRDYGGLLRLSGYDGAHYRLDVPALAVLDGNVDLAYAGWDPNVTDATRAAEFVRDMQRYVNNGRMPSFTYVWLPTSAGSAGAADADRALGTIVDFLSHAPTWSSTAIFISPEGTHDAVDHVNAMRSYALVVSPLAKRGYVGEQHLSTPSVVKTEEEILGLDPLSLNDLLASDMAAFFTSAPDPQPYQAAP